MSKEICFVSKGELADSFKNMKRIIDNYPNAFSLLYSDGKGYYLAIDLDVLNESQLDSIGVVKDAL